MSSWRHSGPRLPSGAAGCRWSGTRRRASTIDSVSSSSRSAARTKRTRPRAESNRSSCTASAGWRSRPGAVWGIFEPGGRRVAMTDPVTAQESLEAVLKDEIIRMYQDVADSPGGEYHFFHGREAAELFGYEPAWLDRAPAGAVASFAGVGNPHLRSGIRPAETVVDLGSGAGLDAIIASWSAGD